jgi:ribosome-associated translation inhibitor RaiA
MNFNISVRNYVLLPGEKQFLDRKLVFLERILKKSKGNPTLDLEVEGLANPTENGDRFKVGATFVIYDRRIHIEDLHRDLKRAFDSLTRDLRNQIIKNKTKYRTVVMRSAVKNKYSFLNKLVNRRRRNDKYTDDMI